MVKRNGRQDNNEPQNTTHKTTKNTTKNQPVVNSCAQEGWAIPSPPVVPIVKSCVQTS